MQNRTAAAVALAALTLAQLTPSTAQAATTGGTAPVAATLVTATPSFFCRPWPLPCQLCLPTPTGPVCLPTLA